jgi:hypothetical protein
MLKLSASALTPCLKSHVPAGLESQKKTNKLQQMGHFAVKNRVLSDCLFGARGGIVVKVLRYKPAGPGFDSRWCHWNFSVS